MFSYLIHYGFRNHMPIEGLNNPNDLITTRLQHEWHANTRELNIILEHVINKFSTPTTLQKEKKRKFMFRTFFL